MDMERITPEMMTKAREAKTPEELMELAAKADITLTADEAEQIFTSLHCDGALTDEELENVNGGLYGSKYLRWKKC